jgi:hypothetical protein
LIDWLIVMAVAMPSTLPMKLRKVEPRGKAAPGIGGRARVLVTVTVLGSAGPLRFLVDEGESVTGLIRAALRCYAREGRMPLLGADAANFLLYTANGRSDGTAQPNLFFFFFNHHQNTLFTATVTELVFVPCSSEVR